MLRAGQVLTVIGVAGLLFVGYEFGLTSLTHDRSQPALLATFRLQLPTTTLDAPTTSPPEGSPTALLDIPRIALDQVVVEGTSPEDLKAGPGHLRASPMPGEYGNAVIAGRRSTYGGPFGQLDQLRAGDPISVTTGQGAFTYRVVSVDHVDAGRADPLIGTIDSRLTLVTSDSSFFPTGRLVVVANLQSKPVAVANRPKVPITTADLGLVGDPVALWFLLLWTPLLIAAVWLVRRLRRQWPLSVSAMFGVPVVLTLAVLALSSLDPVLPGTL
jgi:LPXTG-site transpeptidase (sortase) family protein